MILSKLKEDIQTVFKKDPAARGWFEVILLYPGLHALWLYRVAHAFWMRKFHFTGRLISHLARALTGVEIHPGAKIGRRFFIDHGMGIVIGETAEIGDDVLIYSCVVLGGTTLEKKKRHPTIGNKVLIGASAIVLGPITVGDGARIGAGSVVVQNVPPNTTAIGVPARIGHDPRTQEEVRKLEHQRIPDPIADAIRLLGGQIEEVAKRLQQVEKKEGIKTKVDGKTEDMKKEVLETFAPFQKKETPGSTGEGH